MKLLLLKLVLTLIVGIALSLSFFYPGMGSGILEEMKFLGVIGSTVVIVLFLVLVFFYCKNLQQTLELIELKNRVAKPKSVWFMFLIPYNFIEDFFIIYNISASLKNEAKDNTSLLQSKGYGITSGIGWCTAQILSLIPGTSGQIAGLSAIVLWVIHWRFIRATNQALRANRVVGGI